MIDAKAVVRRYLDALLAGDIDGIRDRIVDDFLVAIGSSLFEAGSQSFDSPTLIGEGDTVALEWRVRAMTAAGDDYDNRYCGIFVVRDGRIQEVRECFDSAYAARVLYPG